MIRLTHLWCDLVRDDIDQFGMARDEHRSITDRTINHTVLSICAHSSTHPIIVSMKSVSGSVHSTMSAGISPSFDHDDRNHILRTQESNLNEFMGRASTLKMLKDLEFPYHIRTHSDTLFKPGKSTQDSSDCVVVCPSTIFSGLKGTFLSGPVTKQLSVLVVWTDNVVILINYDAH